MMKKNSSFVIYKSFENLSLNNFQVIIFERMAKNCFKVNTLSKICQNICFSIKKVIIFYFLYIHELDHLMIITIYYHYLNFQITSATCWEEIIFFNIQQQLLAPESAVYFERSTKQSIISLKDPFGQSPYVAYYWPPRPMRLSSQPQMSEIKLLKRNSFGVL